MNEYFQPGSVPAPNSPGSSATIRAEFSSIASAFDKLPTMAGSANEFVVVNATGTELIASGFTSADIARLTEVQTLTNKTINWSDNTISTIPLAGGGTGATDLAGAQAALGIDLKANANDAVLTGAPVAPTPPTGNSSPRIATTQFVQEAVVIAGGMTPSNATPLMDGVATAGVDAQASRADHIHPTDTSRAPTSAGTASGTSFTPAGGIAATNVQAALVELESDTASLLSAKAPLASPTFTGNPTAPTPLTSDNDTSIATTAFVQSLMAQQPAGMSPSNATPLMDGVAAPGTGVDGSRADHVHPTDTSRAPASAGTASGTSFTPAGNIAATNVQAAMAELDSEKAPASAGTASGTSFTPAGGIAATDVQAALVELDGEKAPTSAGTATGTSFTPAGNIAATNVQAALAELDSEKLQKSLNLSDVPDPATARANLGISTLTSGTAINTTSGTAHDFTGIPSWVKRITLSLKDVSRTAGTGNLAFQLGTSGGIVVTGYTVTSSYNGTGGQGAATATTAFITWGDAGASGALQSGQVVFAKLSGNIWTCSGLIGQSVAAPVYTQQFAGVVDLGAALTTIRVTNTGGDTFDSGSINILYE